MKISTKRKIRASLSKTLKSGITKAGNRIKKKVKKVSNSKRTYKSK